MSQKQVAGPDNLLHSQPSNAIKAALARSGWTTEELDFVEINEAFAAVAVQSLRELGIPADRCNLHGGAIALGHPVGASGARIALHAAIELFRRGTGKAAVSLCGGGGQGDALLLFRSRTRAGNSLAGRHHAVVQRSNQPKDQSMVNNHVRVYKPEENLTTPNDSNMAQADIRKGLAGVVVDYTAVSKVNPDTNSLLYRGYPVQELAAKCSFEGLPTCYGTAEAAVRARAWMEDAWHRRRKSWASGTASTNTATPGYPP